MPFIVYGSITNYDPRIYFTYLSTSLVDTSLNTLNSKTIVSDTNTYSGLIFTSVSKNITLSVSGLFPVTLYILAVGGGGGTLGNKVGNDNGSGGGGAGGLVQQAITLNGPDTITINIGAGGVGKQNGGNTIVSFENATANNITAYGGGYGSGGDAYPAGIGGSGGGAGRDSTLKGGNAYVTAPMQGNPGGNCITGGGWSGAGGGGGAGIAGQTGLGTGSPGSGYAGIGGNGIACSLTGYNSTIYFSGGGGGSNDQGRAGNGGLGGGGGGGSTGTVGTGNSSSFFSSFNGSNSGGNGAQNSGGGAGGSIGVSTTATGGSGVVVIVMLSAKVILTRT